MTRRLVAILLACLAATVPSAEAAGRSPAQGRTWDFESDKPGDSPAGFTFARTGQGQAGRWVIQPAADAPSGKNVLAQTDADDTDYRFPMAVADASAPADLRLSVHSKAVSGKVDQGAGLVFRYRDANNYYVARANALEDNINLYHVVDGSRRQFAGWSGKVTSGVWHELTVTARGDHFEVLWDGKKVIDAQDRTFPDAGKIGLWTKADSVILFDDLKVEPLSP